MAKITCWEVNQCPEEKKQRCPAFTQDLGRRCWRVSGTVCEDDSEKTVAEKLPRCLECEVYNKINRVEWYRTTYFRFAMLVTLPSLIVYAVMVFGNLWGGVQVSTEMYTVLALGGAVLLLIFTLAPAYQMLKPIKILQEKLKEIGTGDLATGEAVMPRRDEFMLLAIALNDLKEVLRDNVQSIKDNAEVLDTSAGQLLSNAQETSAGAQETASTINELSATVENVSENVNRVTKNAESVLEHANEGISNVHELQKSMQSIDAGTKKASDAVQELHQKSGEIGKITELITQLADQTNLLALNAAIEAARAGEQGRGFAVVAEEVRKLAEESGRAADDIRKLIESIQSRTEQAVGVMEQNLQQVKSGVEVSGKVNKSFLDIQERIKELTNHLQSVAASAQQMAAGMNNVAAAAEEQSSASEQVTAAVTTLAELAERSKQTVKRFKI
ncbi:MAG: methyl-accepting chemotaxis protein [Peptococcaceae bacterium]|nr:methyl-accepting chemotaxis protein [Peptococcaceae bacterium]